MIPDHLQHMLDDRYQDLTLPLLVIVLAADALAAAGTPVDRDESTGRVRINGPIPSWNDTIVHAVVPLNRVCDRWLAPSPQGLNVND